MRDSRTIAGEIVLPFFTEGYEGFDINDPKDWRDAEYLLVVYEVIKPSVIVPEVQAKASYV